MQVIAQEGVYVVDIAHRAAEIGVADSVDFAIVVVVDAYEQSVEIGHIGRSPVCIDRAAIVSLNDNLNPCSMRCNQAHQ